MNKQTASIAAAVYALIQDASLCFDSDAGRIVKVLTKNLPAATREDFQRVAEFGPPEVREARWKELGVEYPAE